MKKLPKVLTTETSFSKILAVFIFTVIPVITFFLGISVGYNGAQSLTAAPAPVSATVLSPIPSPMPKFKNLEGNITDIDYSCLHTAGNCTVTIGDSLVTVLINGSSENESDKDRGQLIGIDLDEKNKSKYLNAGVYALVGINSDYTNTLYGNPNYYISTIFGFGPETPKCGGPDSKQCPDGYSCLKDNIANDASGYCVNPDITPAQ